MSTTATSTAATRVLTIEQIAKICGAQGDEVERWFDSGRLKGTRGNSRQGHRIPIARVFQFFMDWPNLSQHAADRVMTKVLIVSKDAVLSKALMDGMPVEAGFRIQSVVDMEIAAAEFEACRPDVLIVDYDVDPIVLNACARLCSRNPSLDWTSILITPSGWTPGNQISGINESYSRPVDVPTLAEHLKELIGTKKDLI